MSLLDQLTQQLDGDAIRQISRQVGADEGAVSKAVSGGLPMLVSALARNTADQGGAASLLGALDRDHDGSVLDDVMGYLGGGGGASAGAGILKHVLGGNRQAGAESAIGQMSGLDGQKVSQILAILAPMVLGALGRQRQQKNLDAGGLADLLGQEHRRAEKKAPEAMGLVGQLLDSDGDGQVADDLARLGAGMLGKFLGGR